MVYPNNDPIPVTVELPTDDGQPGNFDLDNSADAGKLPPSGAFAVLILTTTTTTITTSYTKLVTVIEITSIKTIQVTFTVVRSLTQGIKGNENAIQIESNPDKYCTFYLFQLKCHLPLQNQKLRDFTRSQNVREEMRNLFQTIGMELKA